MEIKKDFSLKKYNSFKVESIAKYFLEIKNEGDIKEYIDTFDGYDDIVILGGGNNTLFMKYVNKLVIKNSLSGKEVVYEDKDMSRVKVSAGEDWIEFVNRTIDNSLAGLENLIDIPGTIGASPIQNIGAYGVEVGEYIYEVSGYFLKDVDDYKRGEYITLSQEECSFSYRNSIFKERFKNKFLITTVTFELYKLTDHYKFKLNYGGIKSLLEQKYVDINNCSLRDVANVVSELRATKLPDWKRIGTAGSFFQNPIVDEDTFEKLKNKYPEILGFELNDGVKLSAGQLIQLCDMKGVEINNVATYKNHALIIINTGKATGDDIRKFAEIIQKKVHEKFQVKLQPEVYYIF